MALHGTIKDFALPDILQLIGIQRKTGILELENREERVTVKFQDGQVVGADTQSESVESRLGSVLVRTGRITQAQLAEAVDTQKKTLQRLGHVLVQSERITADELVEALNVQSTQILYRLFRWREGTYDFRSVDDIEYDESHFTPISSETLLMEGARMVDEWPIIERRIKSEKMILRRTGAAGELELDPAPLADDDLEAELDLELDLGFDVDCRPEEESAEEEEGSGALKLSPDERQVMRLVDGKRTVREICELLTLGEFDTFRILADMLTRNLVESVEEEEEGPVLERGPNWVSRIACWLAGGAMSLLVLGALVSLPGSRVAPWNVLVGSATSEQLRLYGSMARMEKLERAVRLFYLDVGTFPRSAAVLAQGGYLSAEDLRDPWGRPYQYQLSPGGYQLIGLDAAGEMRPELTLSRRLNAVQQQLAAGQLADPP